MHRYLVSIILLFVASCAFAGAVADPSTPAILTDNTGQDTRTTSLGVKLASDTIGLVDEITDSTASLAAILEGTPGITVATMPAVTVTIATISAELADGVQTIGSIGAIINPLPSGNNTIGSVSVIALPELPAGTQQIGTASVRPDGIYAANGSSNPTGAFSAMVTLAGGTGTGLSRWMNSYTLGMADQVDGAYLGAIGNWYFNGTNWDRVRGDRNAGLQVYDTALATPTCSELTSTATAATVAAASNRLWIVIQNKAATESVYVNFDTVATPGFGLEIFAGSSIEYPLGSTCAVSYASTGSVPIFVIQGVRP